MNGNPHPRRERSSVVGPLILIALGVIFLLSNLGVVSGDVWSLLLRLWPVLLVAWGLDGLLRRQGIALGVFLTGLGVVFLLSNFGFLAVDIWYVLLRTWPVFLIALGFDLVIGRRSWWAAALGAVLGLALLGGTLWLSGVRLGGGQPPASASIRQPLEDVQAARVTISPGAAALRLSAISEPGVLIAGSIPADREDSVREQHTEVDNVAVYELRDSGGQFFSNPAREGDWSWDLRLARAVPLELNVSLGAGDADLDLTGLEIGFLQLDMGLGSASVRLPETGRFTARMNGAIGQLMVTVPPALGLRIEADTGIANLDLPEGYLEQDGVFVSPNWDSADHQVTLLVSQAIGQVRVVAE